MGGSLRVGSRASLILKVGAAAQGRSATTIDGILIVVPALSHVYAVLGSRNVMIQLRYFRSYGWSTVVAGDMQR
jgi:hypothetical protein